MFEKRLSYELKTITNLELEIEYISYNMFIKMCLQLFVLSKFKTQCNSGIREVAEFYRLPRSTSPHLP